MPIIYVYLLDENVDVWRPVEAKELPDDGFELLGPLPQGEQWKFPPGSVVRCEMRTFESGERHLAAVDIAEKE
jgi:hypothetical protein